MRKDIQHLQIGKREKGKGKSTDSNNFTTAENIELKPIYTKEDISNFELRSSLLFNDILDVTYIATDYK